MKQLWLAGVLLLLQAILLAGALAATGQFRANVVPDTRGYVEFPFDSLSAALEHPRTIGYPLFLRCVALIRPTPHGVPLAQFIVHVACVIGFWFGIRTIITSPWTSMAAGSSLLYSNVVLRYTSCIAPDSLASSLSIATIGALLLAVKNPESMWRWLLLAAGIFITYQLRPAYLFLVPLIPALGLALSWLLGTRRTDQQPPYRLPLFQLVAAALIPLFLFCTAKWLMIGNFSLVSFGGNNFAGVVTRFLDRETVSELPDDLQPLADEVLRQRGLAAKRHADFSDGVTRSYFEIERGFDIETWAVCVPASQEVYGDDWRQQNRGLADLSKAIVRARPADYGIWLVKALVRGVYMITSEMVTNPVYFLLLGALLLLHAGYVVRRCRTTSVASIDSNDEYFLQINALWLIAISFALLKILAVIVTTPPLGRFMDAGGVFLAPVLVRAVIARAKG